jgi:type IV secretory pathway TrbL component
MLKFIRNYADKINHVEIFPLIGLFIFVGFFIVMLIYVKKMSREDIHELSQLPLDSDNENNTGKNNQSAIRNPHSAIHI